MACQDKLLICIHFSGSRIEEEEVKFAKSMPSGKVPTANHYRIEQW